MSVQLIIDVIKNQLLPRMQSSFRVIPHPASKMIAKDFYNPVYPYGFHAHTAFEWVWCVEQHSFLKIEDTVYQLEAGDFCLLPPCLAHADVYVPALAHNQTLWGTLFEETLYLRIHEYSSLNHMGCKAHVKISAPPNISSVLMMLYHEMRNKPSHYEEISDAGVSILIRLILRACEDSIESHSLGNIALSVNSFLQSHYRQTITLNQISKAVHMSRSYLAASYKPIVRPVSAHK